MPILLLIILFIALLFDPQWWARYTFRRYAKKQLHIQPQDYVAVEQILKATALTYVAASLANILNIWRWIAMLRR